MMTWITGLCIKDDIMGSFDKSVQEPHWWRSRFNGIQKVCIEILKLKQISYSFTHNALAKQLKFHHVLWRQSPKSNQNILNHCSTWTLDNFSCTWIVFHQSNSIWHIRLPCITCHFLVNNLHFIAYSNCIVLPHWKTSRGSKCSW